MSADLLAFQMKAVGLKPKREHKFHHTRLWRFDFAFPDKLIAVEFDGGTFSQGRHTRGKGFEGDCEKFNAAALMGWRVLRFTSKHVTTGDALAIIEEAVKRGN